MLKLFVNARVNKKSHEYEDVRTRIIEEFNVRNQKTRVAGDGFAPLRKSDKHSARCSLGIYLDRVACENADSLHVLQMVLCGSSASDLVVNACDSAISNPRAHVLQDYVFWKMVYLVLSERSTNVPSNPWKWTTAPCRSRILRLPKITGWWDYSIGSSKGVTLLAYVMRAGGRAGYTSFGTGAV